MSGIANVSSEFESGNLVFRDKSKNEIFQLDGTQGLSGKTGKFQTGSITVSAEGATVTDQRDITIALTDVNGNALTGIQLVRLALFADSAGAAFLTGNPSSGLGTNGTGGLATESFITGQTTKGKTFTALTSATGTLALKWLDSGTVAAYLGLLKPDGSVIISAALTNA